MKVMKTNILFMSLLSLVILLSFGVLQGKANETVEIVFHQYSPYQNPNQSGFQNELVRESFKAVGMNTDLIIMSPLSTIAAFYRSVYFVCADGETINDEKKNKKLDVRKISYWNVPIGLMFYKPNLNREQVNALEKSKNFSDIDPKLTIMSYGGYNPFNEAGFKGNVYIKSNSPEQTMSAIKAGRYDLGFEVLGVTPYFVTKENPEALKEWGFVNTWLYVPQYMAFIGSHPKGIYYEKKFKEGLSIIKKNGVYINIYERLYGKNNIPKSAVDDPDHEIREDDLSKMVENSDFDLAKFLRQVRDDSGLITKFVK